MKGKEYIKERSKNILSYIKNNYPKEYQKTLERNSDYPEIYYGDFLRELNPTYKKEDLYLSEENLTNQNRDFNTFIIDKNDYCFVESTGRASELLEFLEVDESEDFFKSKATLIFETKEDYENWCNINDLLKEDYNLDKDYDYVKEMIKVKDKKELREIIRERYEESEVNKTYTIDVSDLDVSNVKHMSFMFRNYESLKEIKGLETWDVSNVINMQGMFWGCDNLEYLDLSNWDTSNVKYMDSMFGHCRELEELKGLGTWNVSNVEDMSFMFNYCRSLEQLDLSNWDVSNVENMREMFSFCKNLERLDLSDWNVSNVENMREMFWGCVSLKEIKGLENWDVSNVEIMDYMFEGTKFKDVNLVELKNIDKKNCFTVQDLKTGSNKLKRLSELDNYQIHADDNVQIDVYIDDVKKFHYKYENERDVIHFNQETKQISTDKGIKPLKGLNKDPDKTL